MGRTTMRCRAVAAGLALAVAAASCGSSESQPQAAPDTTVATTSSVATDVVQAASATRLPNEGGIDPGRYHVDLLGVRLTFETVETVWTAPFVNSSGEALLLSELAQDSGAMVRFSRISGLRTAAEALDPDRHVGSIPVAEFDRWADANNIEVVERRELSIGGLTALQVDLVALPPAGDDQADCGSQNSDFDGRCIFVARLAAGAVDAGPDWAPLGVDDSTPKRFWFVDLGDGTHVFIDVREDLEWPDWVEQWTSVIENMTIDLLPEAAPDPASVAPSRLSLDEATQLVDAVIGTFESRDFAAAAEALGTDGAWVEPDGTEHGSAAVEALFAMYTTIDRIDRGGEGYRTEDDTYAFPIVDVFDSGAEFEYFLEVYATEAGHVRVAVRLDEPASSAAGVGEAPKGLSIGAARIVLDTVIATFETGAHDEAVAAMGPGGAWIEPDGSEYGPDVLAEFIAGFADSIERIERTGDGYATVEGGYAFPVTDFFVDDRPDLDFELHVFRTDQGALRIRVAFPAPGELVATTSSGCLVFDGGERCWETIDGSGGDVDAPLLIDLHGWTDSPADHQLRSSMGSLAIAEGFVGVWPIGVGASWNAGPQCCGAASADDVDDVGFLRAMISELAEALSFDEDRIYVTGLSNGCAMAQRFAAEASDVVAAMACMSHYLLVEPSDDYQPVPVMVLHGDADAQVPYVGDGLFAIDGFDAPTNIESWAGHNGCGDESVEIWSDGGAAAVEFGDCSAGAPVSLVTVAGGDHFLYAGQHTTVDTTVIAWDFLQRFGT